MAWTAPRTWVTGELVTAALMNTHIRDDLNWLAGFGCGGSGFGVMGSQSTQLARIKGGTYTGDGNPTQTITGVGFQSKLIMIKGLGGDTTAAIVQWGVLAGGIGSWNMLAEAVGASLITSNSDGFVTGLNVNARTYEYVCIG